MNEDVVQLKLSVGNLNRPKNPPGQNRRLLLLDIPLSFFTVNLDENQSELPVQC